MKHDQVHVAGHKCGVPWTRRHAYCLDQHLNSLFIIFVYLLEGIDAPADGPALFLAGTYRSGLCSGMVAGRICVACPSAV